MKCKIVAPSIWFQNRQCYPILTLKRQPYKMVKHTQKICRLLPTNCLSVFDHFARLTLKGLNESSNFQHGFKGVTTGFDTIPDFLYRYVLEIY